MSDYSGSRVLCVIERNMYMFKKLLLPAAFLAVAVGLYCAKKKEQNAFIG